MTNNKPAFIATIIVALLAIAVAIFAFWKIAQDKVESDTINEDRIKNYIPADDLLIEMQGAAETLIKNNYTVVKLYFTRGLPREDEPYGNKPEGGFYFVNSDVYKTMEDVQKIVDETFFTEEAARIKNNPLGFGAVYSERDGRLGISENFKEDNEYDVDWENPSYIVIPKSDTECEVKVTLHVGGTPVTEKLNMMKLNGQWLIDRVLY